MPAHRQISHIRGKLVVLSIFAMGLALGLIALVFRASMPKHPATRPSASRPS